MAERTWKEFFLGTEEDRKRARQTLKEMRPDYERPGERKPEKKAVKLARAMPEPPYAGSKGSPSMVKPPKPKAKPAKPRKPVSEEYVENFRAKLQGQRPNAKAGKPVRTANPAFKGNWVGAAPTEMQKRGGRRIKRSSLMSVLKKG